MHFLDIILSIQDMGPTNFPWIPNHFHHRRWSQLSCSSAQAARAGGAHELGAMIHERSRENTINILISRGKIRVYTMLVYSIYVLCYIHVTYLLLDIYIFNYVVYIICIDTSMYTAYIHT